MPTTTRMPLQPILFDLAKGTSVNSYYKKFKRFYFSSRAEVLNYQLEKLKELVCHFYVNNIFFQARLKEYGVSPENIKDLTDLDRIPILERKDLQNNFNSLLTSVKGKLFYGSSSGTTGIPVKYAKDVNGLSAGQASGYCLWELAGWRFGQRKVHIWGNPTSIKKWDKLGSRLKSKVFNQLNVPSTLANSEQGLEIIINTISQYKPRCIEGYASSIFDLARFANEKGMSFPSVKRVLTTGESVLPRQKELVSKVFGPISDFYGCGEINGIAINTEGSDKFYIADYHVIVEAIDIEGNGNKEILITDLDNKAFPFIRYRVGDLIDGVFEPDDTDLVPFSYFNFMSGRSVDTVYLPNGKCIQPINLLGGTLFRQIGGVKQHKVIWQNNQFKFVFSVDSNFNLVFAKTSIEEYLKEYNVGFSIEIVDQINSGSSGKFKFFERID